MKHSIKIGLSFGLTSGIITTLGLMVGLHSSTHSKMVVIGGVLTIAIADALSDALGIHLSEESENVHSEREIWESTVVTFLSKFVFSAMFVIPVLIFELTTAVGVSVVIGLCLLGIFSYSMAKSQHVKPHIAVLEHISIAISVVILTHYVGHFIQHYFC